MQLRSEQTGLHTTQRRVNFELESRGGRVRVLRPGDPARMCVRVEQPAHENFRAHFRPAFFFSFLFPARARGGRKVIWRWPHACNIMASLRTHGCEKGVKFLLRELMDPTCGLARALYCTFRPTRPRPKKKKKKWKWKKKKKKKKEKEKGWRGAAIPSPGGEKKNGPKNGTRDDGAKARNRN